MKRLLMLCCVLAVAACGFPRMPSEGDMLKMSISHHKEIFDQGGRGQVILSMTDNVSADKFFGTNYDNIMTFQNKQTGELYFLKTKLGFDEYATAMLPLGEYEVTNLYMRYTYQTTHRVGNTTYTTTHVITHEHFEQGKLISFVVKSGEVNYLGNFEMVKPDKGATNRDGSLQLPSFVLTDKSGDIGSEQVEEWKKEFGKPFKVQLASVRNLTNAELENQKIKKLAKEAN